MGRKKDIIRRSGQNLTAAEVEDVLRAHPMITDAAVIPVRDTERGEEVKAYVVRRPGSSVTEAELVEWARGEMAAFKYPRSIEFRDTLPTSATGKVLKRELRQARP
jgi:long-chain acyl-CoA synthetase